MRKLILVGLVAGLLVPGVASADALSWFTMSGGQGNVITEGPEQTLLIEKDPAAGTYTFDIDWWIGYTGPEAANWGAALDLTTNDPNVAVSMNVQNQGAAYPLLGGPGTVFPAPGQILENMFVGTFNFAGTPAGATNHIGSFRLTVTKAQPDPGGVVELTPGIGLGGWIQSNFLADFVKFGADPGPLLDGLDITAVASIPAIRIVNIPEPATLALLGLGAVAMIRRRR